MSSFASNYVRESSNNKISYDIMFGDLGYKYCVLRSNFRDLASSLLDTINSTKNSSRKILYIRRNIDLVILDNLKTSTIEIYSDMRRLSNIIRLRIEHIKATRIKKGLAHIGSLVVSLADNFSPFSILRRGTRSSTTEVIDKISDTSSVTIRELRFMLESINQMCYILGKIDRCLILIRSLLYTKIDDNIIKLRLTNLYTLLSDTIVMCNLSMSSST